MSRAATRAGPGCSGSSLGNDRARRPASAPANIGPSNVGTPKRISAAMAKRFVGGKWDTHPSETMRVLGINQASGASPIGPARSPFAR